MLALKRKEGGLQAKESGWCLEVGKSKEMVSPLELPERYAALRMP